MPAPAQRSQKQFDEFYAPRGQSMFRRGPEIEEIPIWAQRRQERVPTGDPRMLNGRVTPGQAPVTVPPGLRRQGSPTMFAEEEAPELEPRQPGAFPAGGRGLPTRDERRAAMADRATAEEAQPEMFTPPEESPDPGFNAQRMTRARELPGDEKLRNEVGDAMRWRGLARSKPEPEQEIATGSLVPNSPLKRPPMFAGGVEAGPAIEGAAAPMMAPGDGVRARPNSPGRAAPRETQVASNNATANDGPKPKRPTMMQPAAPAEPGVPQPAGPASKDDSDANSTKKAADAYMETLKKSLEDDPEETPAEKQKRLQKALFVGGMSMMAASGKHDFWESLGRGGMAGAQASDEEENQRLAKRDKKRDRATTLAKAGYDVSNDTRKAGLDERKLGADELRAQAEADGRGETARHNKAMEGIEGQRAANERSRADNPRSSMRDQRANLEELFNDSEPKAEGETDQAYKRRRAAFVLKSMTERKQAGGLQDRLAARRALKDSIEFQTADEDSQEEMIQAELERGGGGGIAAPIAPAPAAGPKEGATATNPKTGQKLVFRNGKWVE